MRAERLDLKLNGQEAPMAMLVKELLTNSGSRLCPTDISKLLKMKKEISGEKINREEEFMLDIYKLFIEIFCREKPIMLKDFIYNLEKCIILNVLNKVNGHQKKAAKLLGIKYTTLNEKVKKHKIGFKKSPSAHNL